MKRNDDSFVAASGILALYLGLVLLPLLVVWCVTPQSDHSAASEIAKAAALVGGAIIALQFVLATRVSRVTNLFGLDAVMLFHRGMGIFAALLLLLHPVLLAAGDYGWGLLVKPNVDWFIWLGRVALLLLVAQVITSVFRRLLRLGFETWRLLHDFLALGLLGTGFIHAGFAGSDFDSSIAKGVWAAYLIAAISAFTWQRFLRPRQLRQRSVDVLAVQQEAKSIWTIQLQSPGGKPAKHLPGQFHFMTLQRECESRRQEEHHYTISSSPTAEDAIASTIKASGDYTRTIGDTKPGDKAVLHGSFGRFSYVLHPEDHDLVFVAGGIGITPIISMLRHMRDTDWHGAVTLFYATATLEDTAFRDELNEIASNQRPLLQYVHVLSQPPESWEGETGRIDEGLLNKHVNDLSNKAFYLCGPTAMTRGISKFLREQHVSPTKIRSESFSLFEDRGPWTARVRNRWLATILVVASSLAIILVSGFARSSGEKTTQGEHFNEHGGGGGHTH